MNTVEDKCNLPNPGKINWEGWKGINDERVLKPWVVAPAIFRSGFYDVAYQTDPSSL